MKNFLLLSLALILLSCGGGDGGDNNNPINDNTPNGVIETPLLNMVISVGDSVNFSGSATDPDNHLPATYSWDFGAGSGINNSTEQNPGLVTFNNTGIFEVSLTITNSQGVVDPTPAKVSIHVITPSNATLIDNGDTGFATIGNWGVSTNSTGYEGNDYLFSAAAIGPSATWAFSIGSAARFQIEAKWTAHSNRANNAVYVIRNNGLIVATQTIDQRVNGGVFNTIDTLNVDAGSLTISLYSTLNGTVVADAVSITDLGTPINQPPQSNIILPATPFVQINEGESINFSGSAVDPEGDVPLNYLWIFGKDSGINNSLALNPGNVVFNKAGTYTVSFTATDSHGAVDTSPAIVTVQVRSPSDAQIIDNGDTGFSTTGTWTASSFLPGFYGADYQTADQGTGESTATWSFTITQTDQYDIGALWTTHPNRATNATYQIKNNNNNLGSFSVDQTQNGGNINIIATLDLQPGVLEVILTNNANGTVVADAVGVAPVNTDPGVTITSPLDLDLFVIGDVTVTTTAINTPFPNGWGVEFVLDDSTSFQDLTFPYEYNFTGLAQAEYNLKSYIIDDMGVRQGTFTSEVNFGIGYYYVSFGDSISGSVGDDVSADDTSQDGRTTNAGYAPILNDLLTTATGIPHNIAKEPFGGQRTQQAISLIDDVLTRHPRSQYILILFGTNDAVLEVATATFKGNMQTIINKIVAAGKTPVLAKIPSTNIIDPVLRNVRHNYIQAYNVAIDELVTENALGITPPDFYNLYLDKPEWFADDVHPNGIGYQQMADAWLQSLNP